MEHFSRYSSRILPDSWKLGRICALAIIILALGIFLGCLFSGVFSEKTSTSVPTGNQTVASTSGPPSPLDVSIRPLLERLRINPYDPDLLATIGDQYYDHREYAKAVEYYERSLALSPGNVNVRTDMGTAIWYMGDPDGAIREYEASLKTEPNYPQTLLNMGIVKWQGKQDGKAALELWQRLLRVNPNYPDSQKVEKLIQQVQAEVKQTAE